MTLTETSGTADVGTDFAVIIDSGEDGTLKYHGADLIVTSQFTNGRSLEIEVQKYDPESNIMRVYDLRTRSSTFFIRSPVNFISFPMIPTERFILRARIPGHTSSHTVRWVHYEQEEEE